MEGTRDMAAARTPVPHTRESLLAALTEAVHDRDERALRRLLARVAEQVTFADLPSLRVALESRHRDGGHREPGARRTGAP